MRYQFNNAWPPEKVEALKAEWAADPSATRIARLWGTTRNAILSKAQRLGLPRKPPAESRRKQAAAIAKINPAPPPAPASEPESRSVGIPLLDTQNYPRECRYPLWDVPDGVFMVCGAETDGDPYCATHRRKTVTSARVTA